LKNFISCSFQNNLLTKTYLYTTAAEGYIITIYLNVRTARETGRHDDDDDDDDNHDDLILCQR